MWWRTPRSLAIGYEAAGQPYVLSVTHKYGSGMDDLNGFRQQGIGWEAMAFFTIKTIKIQAACAGEKNTKDLDL